MARSEKDAQARLKKAHVSKRRHSHTVEEGTSRCPWSLELVVSFRRDGTTLVGPVTPCLQGHAARFVTCLCIACGIMLDARMSLPHLFVFTRS